MNPPCARCKKTVYPVEKFNCLDKTWHKACFTCETCNLKLTMNTYKGYNKLPYCKTHYPTTKFTAVADTPEAIRLAKQQKNQSEVEYRKEKMDRFREFTPVADSMSNKAASQANKLASSVGYGTPPQQHAFEHGRPSADSSMMPSQPLGSVPTQHIPPPLASPTMTAPAKKCYIAIFDYTAGDDDEVTISEGDRMSDVTVIDEGWMEGKNMRTGKYGMFPSNYVQAV